MKNLGRNLGIYLLVFIAVLSLSMFMRNMGSGSDYKEIKFSQFANHLESGDYEKVNITDRQITGTKDNGDVEIAYSPSALEINWLENNILFPMMDEGKIDLESDPPKSEYTILNLLPTILMVLAMVFLFYFMMSQGGNKQAFQFGKNRARLYKSDGKSITFKDVAGLEEEKEELAEIVDFLKNPIKYDKLGARIPKGVLLVGQPGTGKTYISRATAGEAGVPFFTISGSDFVEMFVGVGASRVRDLFNEAKKNAPCIVFIDEIDAVGRRRGAGLGGGNDEREQTLNQLLVEMDGFDGNMGIIILAATNRPDVLDPALLRPGRFDRQVVIGMPDIKGREELFRLYTKNKPLASDVSPEILAKRTPGFSPADIENLINEAALLTARRNGTTIRMDEIEEATTKVMAGPQKKSRVISDKEKKLTAYHEAGHAIVMRALPDSDPVHQITIIPRGMAGGFTMWLPEEDRFFETRGHMVNTIRHLLGGRVAEELKLDDISTGASNDLERATGIAREMVTKYGFSEKLGPVSFSSNDEVFLGRDFSTRQNISEEVAAEVDREIRRILDGCYSDTRRILIENNAAFERVAQALLLVETLDGDQFERLFKGEVSPEDILREVEAEIYRTEQENQKEAEESARIDEENRKAFEEQLDKMSEISEREKLSSTDELPEFVRRTARRKEPPRLDDNQDKIKSRKSGKRHRDTDDDAEVILSEDPEAYTDPETAEEPQLSPYMPETEYGSEEAVPESGSEDQLSDLSEPEVWSTGSAEWYTETAEDINDPAESEEWATGYADWYTKTEETIADTAEPEDLYAEPAELSADESEPALQSETGQELQHDTEQPEPEPEQTEPDAEQPESDAEGPESEPAPAPKTSTPLQYASTHVMYNKKSVGETSLSGSQSLITPLPIKPVTDAAEKKSAASAKAAVRPGRSGQSKASEAAKVEDYEKATEILQQNILKHSQKSQNKDAEDNDQE